MGAHSSIIIIVASNQQSKHKKAKTSWNQRAGTKTLPKHEGTSRVQQAPGTRHRVVRAEKEANTRENKERIAQPQPWGGAELLSPLASRNPFRGFPCWPLNPLSSRSPFGGFPYWNIWRVSWTYVYQKKNVLVNVLAGSIRECIMCHCSALPSSLLKM